MWLVDRDVNNCEDGFLLTGASPMAKTGRRSGRIGCTVNGSGARRENSTIWTCASGQGSARTLWLFINGKLAKANGWTMREAFPYVHAREHDVLIRH